MRSWLVAGVCVGMAAGCATSRSEGAVSTGAVGGTAALKASEPAVQCSDPACADGVKAADKETFTSPELGVEIDTPEGSDWALATDVVSPQGNAIPVVVAHPESGAQIVMQVSEGLDTPEALATMLRAKLGEEGVVDLGQPEKLAIDSGADAYGFDFSVDGEAKGRVALIALGDQIVLVVASWPPQAGSKVVKDIDGVVRSVRRPVGGATPTMLRPDKA